MYEMLIRKSKFSSITLYPRRSMYKMLWRASNLTSFEIGVQQWSVVCDTFVFRVRCMQQKRSPPSAQRLPSLLSLQGIYFIIPQTYWFWIQSHIHLTLCRNKCRWNKALATKSHHQVMSAKKRNKTRQCQKKQQSKGRSSRTARIQQERIWVGTTHPTRRLGTAKLTIQCNTCSDISTNKAYS